MAAAGDVIDGRFTLLEPAGSGGMGHVFRARDATNDRIVAIKILNLRRKHDLGRFQREGAVLSTLVHPSIVQYVAHGASNGLYYLAEEWLGGGNTLDRARSRGLTPDEALAIIRQVASALVVIHQAGIVHRDLKPANIVFMDPAGDGVKLVDFGVARRVENETRITSTGILVGTPSYASPEQVRGERSIGSASDVFSLGCVFFELLTGQTAFAGKSPRAVHTKILLFEPPKPSSLIPLPPEADEVIEQLLKKSLDERPADGAAALKLLERLPSLPDAPRRRTGELEQQPTRQIRLPLAVASSEAAYLVLGAPPTPVSSAETSPNMMESSAGGPTTDDSRVQSLRERVGPFGGLLEVTSDQAVLVVLTGGEDKLVAERAARCALAMRDELADLSIILVSARHLPGRQVDLEDLVERGCRALHAEMLAQLFNDGAADDRPGSPEIRLDADAASALDGAFVIEQRGGGFVLCGDVA